MARSLSSILLVFLVLGSVGSAAAQSVELEVVEERPEEGAGILTVRRPRDEAQEPPPVVVVERVAPTPDHEAIVIIVPPPVAEPVPHEPGHEMPIAWASAGMIVERLELAGLDLSFDAPEVGLLEGARIAPTGDWGSPFAVGLSAGTTIRPLPWLRLPEIRVEVGGGTSDGPWVAPQDAAGSGLTARLTSIFYLRGELRAGVAIPLGWVEPYAVGRIAVAGYFIGADVEHATLGPLGSESMVAGAFEAGFEAGATFTVVPGLQLFGAWRETFTGARGSGMVFGLTAAFPSE